MCAFPSCVANFDFLTFILRKLTAEFPTAKLIILFPFRRSQVEALEIIMNIMIFCFLNVMITSCEGVGGEEEGIWEDFFLEYHYSRSCSSFSSAEERKSSLSYLLQGMESHLEILNDFYEAVKLEGVYEGIVKKQLYKRVSFFYSIFLPPYS